MKTNWPVKKLGEVLLVVIFIATAIFLFSRSEYFSGLLAILALIPIFNMGRLKKFSVKKGGFVSEFYEFRLSTIMKVTPEQMHIERIKIDQGEIIMGISSDTQVKTAIRFLADIISAFTENATIRLECDDAYLNNSLMVPEGATGLFEDTTGLTAVPNDLSRIKVVVHTGKTERIYCPITIP